MIPHGYLRTGLDPRQTMIERIPPEALEEVLEVSRQVFYLINTIAFCWPAASLDALSGRFAAHTQNFTLSFSCCKTFIEDFACLYTFSKYSTSPGETVLSCLYAASKQGCIIATIIIVALTYVVFGSIPLLLDKDENTISHFINSTIAISLTIPITFCFIAICAILPRMALAVIKDRFSITVPNFEAKCLLWIALLISAIHAFFW